MDEHEEEAEDKVTLVVAAAAAAAAMPMTTDINQRHLGLDWRSAPAVVAYWPALRLNARQL